MRKKSVRKLLCVLMALALAISMMPYNLVDSSAETVLFSGGSGTENDPFLIGTKEQLNNARKDLGAHYKLISDIVFAEEDFEEGGAFYNGGQGWEPIGSVYPYFSGVFDGNGFDVINLTIKSEAISRGYVGLFGINKGIIKNLGNCNQTINVVKTSDYYLYVGGIVGYNKGIITKCYNSGNVIGLSNRVFCGGIAGYNDVGEISECVNKGNILSSYLSGGVAGGNSDNSSKISNCYNMGIIRVNSKSDNAYTYAGGIAGWNFGMVECCYNIGAIAGAKDVGGISGYNTDTASLRSSFYLNNSERGVGLGDDEGTVKCTLDDMKSQIRFGGFDFESTWTMSGEEDYFYPELINRPINFEKKYIGITLLHLPYKTEYYEKIEDLDLKGGKIAANYNDGTYIEVELNNSMVSGYDKNKAAIQELTVVYNGEYTTFNVENFALIYDEKITTDQTCTVDYKAYRKFNFVLSDQSIAKITNVSSSSMQWGSSYSMQSSATIEPLMPGFVAVRTVDEKGEILSRYLLLIEEGNHQMFFSKVLKDPTCTEEGLEQYCCKFCDYQEERTVDALGHSWDEGLFDGHGNVHYSCVRCDATYTKSLTSIELTSKPSKLEYLEGKEQLDVTGGKVTVSYNNGTKEEIDLTNDMVTGFDNSKVGKQTLTVTYQGKTATFDIEVIAKSLTSIELTSKPSKLEYLEGKEQLDVTGGKVTVSYNNGTKEEIDLTNDMVTGFDNSKVGKQTLTVTYQGKTATFDIEVIAKSLTSIELTSKPSKLEYLEGKEQLDVTGGKVTVSYNNGTKEEIDLTNDMVTGFDNSKVGKQTLTVTYQGKTASFDIEVIAKLDTNAPNINCGNDETSGCPKLTWKTVYGAEKYEIWRATSKTGKFYRMYTTSSTEYVNTSAEAGKTYYYKIRAIGFNGTKGSYSNTVSRTCDCAAPVIKAGNNAETGKVTLSWSKIEGATKYWIYRSTDGKTFKYYDYTTRTSYTNKSTYAGKTYYYKVKAATNASEYAASTYSNAVSRTCDCAAPVIKAGNNSETGKVTLSWSKVEGATKYWIYRSTDGKTFKYYDYSTRTSYTNKSTYAGKTYYYKVKAATSASEYAASTYSNTVSRTCDCARPVVSAKDTATAGNVKLTWKAVEGATKYWIYRSTDGKTFKYYDCTTNISYTNKSTYAGKTYYYKVKAATSASEYAASSYSNTVSCKVR